MIEHFRSRLDDAIKSRIVVEEVGRENFDTRSGSLPYCQHRLIKVFGTPVGEVVARDRRDDDMLELQPMSRFRDTSRFVIFQLVWSTP